MSLTLIGVAVLLAGLYLLVARRVEAMFVFTLICTLMGGSAAIGLPALGGASISPAHLALGFLLLRIVLHKGGDPLALPAIRGNAPLILFAGYAVAGALTLPRIFARAMNVVPMRPVGLRSLYDVFPLVPTSQNITAAVYIAGTAIMAICAFIAVRQPRGAVALVKAACVVVALHALTGIMGVAGKDTFVDGILNFFRNGSYAQLDQSFGGYVRIAGIMPEASTYAAFAAGWLAFLTELWLRDVMPRRTGGLAIVMTLVLVCSTSSTAYVFLTAYALVLTARMLWFPRAFGFAKLVPIMVLLLASITLAALLALLKPALAESLLEILKRFTVDKASSTSGLQRGFWAKQGLDAFRISYGLGIGAGSFRSSSLATAILGSVGVIGVVSFAGYLILMFKPLRDTTFGRPANPVEAVGVAASWAALLTLVPQLVGAPSPDPGLPFAVLAGAALGLRSLRRPLVGRRGPMLRLPPGTAT